ncbi:hypothetical protein PLEOSDRAFT_1107328 [Pleurotus ostreatus PC15]|uniref:G domain-containing protein n=2 Tax=Pleurotus TaxID=5320 RepID=A0A067NBU2_PLEO1|nr:hypothetical protein CCMSSC00406_0002244 [Pleurotus cornucopiae]KDQ24400.1 hypothetical protein PLEOSDRAFT_1107328 [Pleurotus ostreatus PC15]
MTSGQNVLIAVMGATGSGKTTFINTASGDGLRVGLGLRSCTSEVQLSKPFQVDDRLVTLIDTPGFDDTTKSDADILAMIAAFLASTYRQGTTLSGVIYIHRISDFRMGGISTRNFKMFRKLCGEATLRNVVLVSNMWSQVSPQVGEAREAELASDPAFFKPVLDKGAQFMRNDNTFEGAKCILGRIIQNHPLPLCIQTELVDEGRTVVDTTAGAELDRELREQVEKHKEEMRQVQNEMSEAIRLKDEETKLELQSRTNELQAEIQRVRDSAQNLATNYHTETARLQQQMKEIGEATQRERDSLIAQYEGRLNSVNYDLQQIQRTSDNELVALRTSIQQLEAQKEEAARRAAQARKRRRRGPFGIRW